MIDLALVDDILGTAVALGAVPLAWEAHPEACAALLGSGVTIVSEDEADQDVPEAEMSDTPSTLRRVSVDVLAVLRETLITRGFTVDTREDAAGAFLALTNAELPPSCDAYFSAEHGTPLYAARALSSKAVTLVLHVEEQIADDAVLHSMGVHPVRLRDLDSLSRGLRTALEDLSTIRSAVTADGEPIDSESAEKLSIARRAVNPAEVVTYARTMQDRDFESATARILAPLTKVVPLGGKYTGRPFPDGLLVSQQGPHQMELVHYDCKSKQEDYYGLDSAAGDQQGRYLAITKRLEMRSWRGRGTVLFTPHVDTRVFAEKIEKDCWRLLRQENRKLLVIPATALHRWYDLSTSEGLEKLCSLFSPKFFWSALLDGALPGLSEERALDLWPAREAWARLLTEAQAEMCFLAGLAEPPPWTDALAPALGATDGGPTPAGIVRSTLVSSFHRCLRTRVCTLSSLAEELRLSGQAVRYLVHAREFAPQGLEEAGENGFSHLLALRRDD